MRSQTEAEGTADRETAAERMLFSATPAPDALPAALCICDRNGRIVRYSEHAAALWGRAPQVGDPGERFCGSHRIFRLDGSLMPHAESAMAEALHRGVAVCDREVVIERPDGSRAIALVNVDPFKDEAGMVIGAVSWFHDISHRARSANGEAPTRQQRPSLPSHVARDGDPLRVSEPRPGLGNGSSSATSIESSSRPVPIVASDTDMGSLICTMDWSKTAIGPMESWSSTLRMMVNFLLANRFPLLLWWGPEYIQLYNDAYRPIPGTKHPGSLGQPAKDCWPEIWHVIGPLIDRPFYGGPATWMEDIFLEVNRHGFVEETHFTIAYSPVPDATAARGIGGVLATVHEITEKVVGERRIVALRDLGARAAEAKSAEEACAIAAEILARHPQDIPFALIYLVDRSGARAHLAGTAGIGVGEPASPVVIDLQEHDGNASGGWRLGQVSRDQTMRVVEDIGSLFSSVPPGPWSDRSHTAVVLPIPSNRPEEVAGYLVAGVSSRLKLDELYRSFLGLIRTQVAAAIANARAYEEERRRVAALAEIDRAKTAFFSNVSHEFRTPLTLMLGPLEELKREFGRSASALSTPEYQQVDLAYRNGLRLLKLVNALLDFSRIEAGRVQAAFERTDLPAYTAELAGVFRSAVERSGLRFSVECPPLDDEAFVDRDMWEKIVLNLISNAFKFTQHGEIGVALRKTGTHFELVVHDTGIGMADDQLPKVFERFHRVPGAQARTHEGAGIGLALVQELARLHGGEVSVESRYGKGSTFRVTIPVGRSHLPEQQVGARRNLAPTAPNARLFVEEALHWVPEGETADDRGDVDPVTCAPAGERARILLADDNADMRGYVHRLLSPQYEVEAVGDGEQALASIARRVPDLVLTDVMMPRLDGFGLLAQVRADPCASATPVILLSARAGEESRIEGLQAGADDYLIKPFSARELMARVEAHLKLKKLREQLQAASRESEERFRALADNAPALIWINGPEGCEFVNRRYLEFLGVSVSDVRGYDWAQFIHADDRDGYVETYLRAVEQRDRFEAEFRFRRRDGEYRWMRSDGHPRFDAGGTFLGYAGLTIDVTEHKAAEQALRAQTNRLAALNRIARTVSREFDLERIVQTVTDSATELSGAQFGAFFYNVQNERGESYQLFSLSGAPREAFEKFGLPRNTAVFEPTFRGAGVVRSDDIRKDPRYGKNAPHHGMPRGHLPVVSYLAVPVVSRSGEVHGGLFFGHEQPGVFTPEAEEIVMGIAAHAAIAIDNSRLYHAEKHLSAIVEASADAIVSKDLNGVITSWNKGAEHMFGYAAGEVIGKPVTIVIPPDRQDEEPEILRRIRRGECVEHYETVRLRKDGSLIDVSLSISPVKDASGIVIGASKIARDISQRKRAQEQQELLAREIHHRTKNLFAVVQAVVSRSFAGKQSVEGAQSAVLGRLHALAETHTMLMDKDWQGADLADVVRTEMSPYAGRVTIEGPSLILKAKTAQHFVLAVHELATNAAKYGALSNSTGRVDISWSRSHANGSGVLIFRWQERGGPPVAPPARKGFGSAVLEHVMAEYFDPPPRIDFKADGVAYELTGPFDALMTDGGQAS